MKTAVVNAATLLVAIGAAAVANAVVHVHPRAEIPQPRVVVSTVSDWQRLAHVGSVIGRADAEVRIVEFADFQCPACAAISQRLDTLMARHWGRIAIVYRNFPLQALHPKAFAAAIAAACAGAQGRFAAYHDALFRDQGSLEFTSWHAVARGIGIPDLARFDACVSERRTAPVVERDIEAGERAGVPGTPTFIFGGRLVAGYSAMDSLETWVDQTLLSR